MLLFKTEDMAKSWRRHYNFYLLSSLVFWFCFLAMHRLGYTGLTSACGCLLRLGRLGGLRGVIQLAFPVQAMLVRAATVRPLRARAGDAGGTGEGAAGGGDAGGAGAGAAGGTGAGFSRVRA